MNRAIDPVKLASELVQCPSVTPEEGGAISLLQSLLVDAGFRCERADRNGIANLLARWDGPENRPAIGFNGHTDVVPPGDESSWRHDPFGGKIRDGFLWGRGATDMKSAVAAFVSAAVDFVQASPGKGSIALAITGDEEGAARDGTLAILDLMEERGEIMDACIVGEPTCREKIWRYRKGRSARFNGGRIRGEGLTGSFRLSASGDEPDSSHGATCNPAFLDDAGPGFGIL